MEYNLLIDYNVIYDGSSVTSGNGLQSDHFATTFGASSQVITTLIGANVISIFREQTPLEVVTGVPGTDQCSFDILTGTVTVNSGQTFTNGEKLFITFSSAGVQTSTEPLTVQEVKDYLRLEGFIDTTDSLSTDFDDDDTIIGYLITSARTRLEEWTGKSFIPKTIEIEFTSAGNYRIPFGPVTSITSLEDSDGTAITDYTVSLNNSILKTPTGEEMVLTYEAGYVVLPKALKDALYKEVAYRYEHRGEEFEDKGICVAALNLAGPYKEVDTWLV